MRMIRNFAFLACLALVAPVTVRANVGPDVAQKLYDRVTPSLVVVKYTWESELGRRELMGPGTVVSEDGLILLPIGVVDLRIPDEQLKEFKILIPSQTKDPEEIEAEFQGRDERNNVAFVKAKPATDKEKAHKWKALKFEEVPPKIGEPVLCVGLLPETAAFKTYFTEAVVGATLRGDVAQVLVSGSLAMVGAPVFNAKGQTIGMVAPSQNQPIFLNDTGNNLAGINNPPKIFTPTRDFQQSLEDPPVAGKPQKLPWMGVPQLTGLNKDVSEVFNLTDQPAVQVGEVIPETPAAKAGLKQGDIIVKVDGKPLERGDQPEELPMILRRQITRMKVGQEISLSILRKKGQPLQELKFELGEQPARPNSAKRYWAEDLGFAVRDLTFFDTYARRLPQDTKGVTVALIRPQSSAQTGGLQNADMVSQLNGQAVTDVGHFQTLYKEARKAKPKEAVVLVVRRADREDTVRIEPPQ